MALRLVPFMWNVSRGHLPFTGALSAASLPHGWRSSTSSSLHRVERMCGHSPVMWARLSGTEAHLTALRRTEIGPWNVTDAYSVADLKRA